MALNDAAVAGDVKKLAELLKEKMPTIKQNYKELAPSMTLHQRDMFESMIPSVDHIVQFFFERGSKTVPEITKVIPRLIALLDDMIAENATEVG